MPQSPYVVGQWVRGERFYGRTALIEEALEGHRDWVWLLGTRRIGKTSFLKQLEWIAQRNPDKGFLPLFWDLQGSVDVEELCRSFDEAILDAEDLLEERGIPTADVRGSDLFESLSQLRRRVRAAGFRLLLLCDEVEELIELHRTDPVVLRKLRRALQSKDDVRTIMASTIRLWALAEQGGDTSPFLHGFTPPLYIQRMTAEEARSLVMQSQMPEPNRPPIDQATADCICHDCDHHPYLLQLLAKRYLEAGDMAAAVESVATDEMISYFFSVDYDMLSGAEKNILRALAESGAVADTGTLAQQLSIDRAELSGHLQRLASLSYIRRSREGPLEFSGYFFRRWMSQQRSRAETPAFHLDAGSRFGEIDPDTPTHRVPFDSRYRLDSEIGRGATGVVYKAFDEVVRETIAIKIIRKEYSGHPEALGRLRQELTLARNLGHPNILRVYHLGESRGQYYITMQLVTGGTLGNLMASERPLPVPVFVELSRKIASALEAAHGNRVLHRDIKPQNILLDERREPYLTDFGLARLVDAAGLTESGVFVGTPAYASPEQASLMPLDERSDIYSLGALMFEMATGAPPFRSIDVCEVLKMHRTASPPDPRSLRPDLPPALAEILLTCLQKGAAARFQSVTELRSALERAAIATE